MERIPREEVTFHPHSFGDPDGRLFWWHGELYRGIGYEKADFFKRLFENGVIQELASRELLIGSEPTYLALDGYAMVIRHRSVPFVSYPHEWCAAMFKEAALAYLDLVTELVSRGFTLKDTHPWNLLFEGTKPVYVDLTSIKGITDTSRWVAYDKFRRYYLYPLILMSNGQERIARHFLPDYEGISARDLSMVARNIIPPESTPMIKGRVATALARRLPEAYRDRFKRGLKSVGLLPRQERGRNGHSDPLSTLRREIESVRLPAFRAERRDLLSIASSQNTDAERRQTFEKIIAELRPGSVLAISSRAGDHCRWAALAGNRAVALDPDSSYVTQLYYEARSENLPLLPLVMDFADPTPSRGLSNHLSIAATERLQCDMVLALGLVDRLVSERHLRFDQIVDGMAQFAKRWLVIDFMQQNPRERKSQGPSPYTREDFVNALRKRFRKVNFLSPHSTVDALLLCEK